MIRYELIIYWSDMDQSFIVEVQNAEIVIQEWIETAQELGRSIPEPKGRLIFA